MSAFDVSAIARLMGAFFATVSFDRGDQPAYGDLLDLFIPGAHLIRTSGTSPEVATIEDFVRARRAAYDAGNVLSFEERELRERTDVFGNIAHRLSPYAKRALTKDGLTDARGVISTQFVRTADGWRISSMAWDDEREGLRLDERGL